MTHTKTAFISVALGVTLATGIAFAQGYKPPQLFGRADPELRAARQALDDALAHLQKARNSDSEEIVKARGYIEQAEAAIDPNFDSFSAPAPLPPPPK